MKKSLKITLIAAGAAVIIAAGSITAVSVHRNSPEYALSLAERYLSEMNYEQAVIQFEKYLEIDPKNSEVWLMLADTYEKMGEEEKVKDVLERAVKEADSRKAGERLEKLEEEGREESAETTEVSEVTEIITEASSLTTTTSATTTAGTTTTTTTATPEVSVVTTPETAATTTTTTTTTTTATEETAEQVHLLCKIYEDTGAYGGFWILNNSITYDEDLPDYIKELIPYDVQISLQPDSEEYLKKNSIEPTYDHPLSCGLVVKARSDVDTGHANVSILDVVTLEMYSDYLDEFWGTVEIEADKTGQLQIGDKVQLTINGEKKADWKTSNPYVASVNSKGVVTVLHEGAAVISCEYEGRVFEYREISTLSPQTRSEMSDAFSNGNWGMLQTAIRLLDYGDGMGFTLIQLGNPDELSDVSYEEGKKTEIYNYYVYYDDALHENVILVPGSRHNGFKIVGCSTQFVEGNWYEIASHIKTEGEFVIEGKFEYFKEYGTDDVYFITINPDDYGIPSNSYEISLTVIVPQHLALPLSEYLNSENPEGNFRLILDNYGFNVQDVFKYHRADLIDFEYLG